MVRFLFKDFWEKTSIDVIGNSAFFFIHGSWISSVEFFCEKMEWFSPEI